jgi:ubiquinone biosynthesis protein COQ9
MFPNGTADITDSLVDYLNAQTIDFFNNTHITGIKAILKTLIMFQIRIKPNMPDNFKKIFNISILKSLPIKNIQRFYALIDTLWYCAGDTATDYNYYTKRFLLGNIYLETCFYACSDTSDNFTNTEDYLIRSFDKIKIIEDIKNKIPDFSKFQENIVSWVGKIRYTLS